MTELDRRFDELARSLAEVGHTRRAMLKAGLGVAGAMAAAMLPGRAFAKKQDCPSCPPGDDPCGHTCCGPQQTCVNGNCFCKPDRVFCGDRCCHPLGSTCCGPSCCPPGEVCTDFVTGKCSGKGCPGGTKECGTTCCGHEQTCVSGNCFCPPDSVFCGSRCCRPLGSTCCGPACCPPGSVCTDFFSGACEPVGGCPPPV